MSKKTPIAPLEVFTARDLRQRSGDLFRDAEEGRLALITRNGRPAALAIPFDELLLGEGVQKSVALHLFEAGQATLAKASRLAGLTIDEFLDLLAKAGLPAVDYDIEGLEVEVEAIG